MSDSFLHGVETVEVQSGAAVIRQVKAAVIGIVGTAPIYSVDEDKQTINEPTLILGDVDGAQYFGEDKDGYTIRKAIDAIVAQKKTAMIVVNVFDPDVHKTSISEEVTPVPVEFTFDSSGEIDLGHEGISDLVMTSQDVSPVDYEDGVDFDLDPETGIITIKEDGNIEAAETVNILCDYADPSLVTASDIIGTVDGDGNRTGLQAFKDCYNLLGFFPKIIICPGFSDQAGVSSAMKTLCDSIRARAIADAEAGLTVQEAIAARGELGANFYTSSERMTLCYPKLEDEDGNMAWYSQYFAGAWAKRITENGFWWSPSNMELNGIIGAERKLSAIINDATCEVNLLNEAGITTIFNSFGTGLRTWGNRSAAYPTNTDMENFMNIQLTKDILHESIEYAQIQNIDKPMGRPFIDAVTESVNGYFRGLIGRGALIDGRCSFLPEDNTVEELAAGHIVYSLEFCGTPPMERITFKSYHNINMLSALLSGGA